MTGEELAGLLDAEFGRVGDGSGAAAGSGGASLRSAGETERVRWEAGPATVTLTVPAPQWLPALAFARDRLAAGFFDWLTAVDDGPGGLRVVVHLYSLTGRHHVYLHTRPNGQSTTLPSATGLFRGADWHERETWEMFGVTFDGHPRLVPLLLPDGFEGHPLRKDFALAARAARPWPGGPEPGEQAGAARGRRRIGAPGVPEGWEVP